MLGTYYPIIAALMANIFAQVVKVPIHYLIHKELDFKLMFSTGGMPSSHSATVAALTTAIGIYDGLDSTTFALSLVLTGVVAYDAMGIRRHAGKHAVVINDMMQDLYDIMNVVMKNDMHATEKEEELKELLGHQPIEVFFGLITGVLVGVALYLFI